MRRRFDQRSDGRRPSATLAFVSMLVPLLLIYASPAMAGGSDHLRHHPDHWEAFLSDEGFEGPDCVKIEGESRTNFTAETEYDLVVVKKGSGQNDQRLYWDVGAGTELAPHETQGDGTGYSYVITCVTGEATVPSDGPIADVTVIGALSADDEFVLSVASANATVDVDFNADGDFDDEGEIDVADGIYPIGVVADIEWRATAHAGAQFTGGATTDSGTVAHLDRADTDAAHALLADVAVIGACSADDEFVLSVAGANATVDVDFNADGDFDDEGEIDVADGTYPIGVVADIEWRATAHAGAQFTGGATTDSGTIVHLDCVDADVLGVSITSEAGTNDTPAEVAAVVRAEAPGEVQAAELPFTGSETGRLIALAALLLGSGTLLLRAVARGGEI